MSSSSSLFLEKEKIPTSFIMVITLLLLACALTWALPAGEYARYQNESGLTVVDPEVFYYLETSGVHPITLPIYVARAFVANIDLICALFFSGGAFGVISKTGALQVAVMRLADRFRERRYLLIVILTVFFALICTNQAIHLFIPFAPILVYVVLSLGFDSITGVAIILLGGGIGFSTGTLRTTTTMVAQKIAGLPVFSGLGYRAFCLVVFLLVTCPLLCMYAKKVAADPTYSSMYKLDQLREQPLGDSTGDSHMTPKQCIVLAALILSLVVMVTGSIRFGWGVGEVARVFLVLGIVAGVISGFGAKQICKIFLRGCAGMVTAVMIVGIGSSVGQVLVAGHITDTIVAWLASLLVKMPYSFQGVFLYLSNALLNGVITSGTAQATIVMPIIIPLSDMVGITRQTVVLAYNFGDGLGNYILPTSSALMGVLGAANVPFDRWIRFMWKIFVVWTILACLLVMGAQYIKLGPF